MNGLYPLSYEPEGRKQAWFPVVCRRIPVKGVGDRQCPWCGKALNGSLLYPNSGEGRGAEMARRTGNVVGHHADYRPPSGACLFVTVGGMFTTIMNPSRSMNFSAASRRPSGSRSNQRSHS